MKYRRLEPITASCGYLPGFEMRQEHHVVIEADIVERSWLLENGYRSFGRYFFRPRCSHCGRCVPLRVPISSFRPSKSQRRVLKRCRHVMVTHGEPMYTEEKLNLYRNHLTRFHRANEPMDEENFRLSFYDPDTPTIESCYYVDGRLAGVGIVGVAHTSLSSVYFFFGREWEHLSLGTFSVLQEIDLAQELKLDHLYLGYWIRDCPSMRYKSQYRPCERLGSDGQWQPFNAHAQHDPRWHPRDSGV